MNSLPLLYTGAMVRATLADIKTMTRRVVKGKAFDWLEAYELTPEFVALPGNAMCPNGQPGDQLWVRETFFAWGRWETRFSVKKGRDEWHFVDMTLESGRQYHYAVADQTLIIGAKGRGGVAPMWWTRPAIFMPRAASRITLEITEVRVERLQDISDADAVAEGADCLKWSGIEGTAADLIDWPLKEVTNPYRNGFAVLWESINGDGSWAANPWVWVVSFRRLP